MTAVGEGKGCIIQPVDSSVSVVKEKRWKLDIRNPMRRGKGP